MLRAPMPARGFTTTGVCQSANTRRAASALSTLRVAGARDAGRLEDRLHACLVTEVLGRGCIHARDTQSLPHLGQGNLQWFEDAGEYVDATEPGSDRADAVRELVGIEAVADSPVTREPVTKRLGEPLDRIAAHDRDLGTVDPQERTEEPVRRLHRIRRHEHDLHHVEDRSRVGLPGRRVSICRLVVRGARQVG